MAGFLSDDSWEDVCPTNDVLSDTDTSEGDGEAEENEAGAIIEALEEAPQGNLQGVTLGSLPQFLGGWYGSSPPAAGCTFSVDVSPTPSASPAGAAAAPAAEEAEAESDTYENLAEESAAPPAALQTEKPAAAADLAAATPDAASTDAAAAPAAAAGLSQALLLCLVSAGTLAMLLLLLGAVAGTHSYAHTDSPAAPAFRTTLTDGYRATRSDGHLSKRHSPSLHAAMPTAAPAAPPAAAAARAGAHRERSKQEDAVPWWLRTSKNASAASKRAGTTQGSVLGLPPLPPSLQLVVEGSARANMSASQRLRLHLWLLHCATRNASTAQQGMSGQAAGTTPAGRPYAPYPLFAARRPSLPVRAAPYTHQCALSGTARDWLVVDNTMPAGLTAAQASAPAANLTKGGRVHQGFAAAVVRPAGNSSAQTPAQHALDSVMSFLQPFGVSDSSCIGSAGQRRRAHISAGGAWGCSAALCFAFKCRPGASNATVVSAAAMPRRVAPPPAPGRFVSAPRTPWEAQRPAPAAPRRAAAPPAAAAAAAASTPAAPPAARQPVIVPPTQAVPPLYRPPLPCLLVSNRRPNRTMHGTAAPSGRTKTWPNATARHLQAPGVTWPRGWAARTNKLYGRTLAMGMARWGWHQQQQQQGYLAGLSGPSSWPMLPPVTLVTQQGAGDGCNQAASSRARTSGSSSNERGATCSGLALPMLPPVPEAADDDAASMAADRCASTSGSLTLPMLPPTQSAHDSHSTSSSVQEAAAANAWQQLLGSSASHSSGGSTCRAHNRSSYALILIHTLEAPSAAAAAAACAAEYAGHSAQHDTARHAAAPGAAATTTGRTRPLELYNSRVSAVQGEVPKQASATSAVTAAAAAVTRQQQQQQPGSNACQTRCAEVCRLPQLCGAVCFERCAGLPDMHFKLPQRPRALQATAVPLPPAQHPILAAAKCVRPRAIPLPPVKEARIAAVAARSHACLTPVLPSFATAAAAGAWAPAPLCGNNGTWTIAVTAAGKLAAAAADLASAAAGLAAAAAKLAAATSGGTQCLPAATPLPALPAGQKVQEIPANVSTACSAPRPLRVLQEGLAGAASSASSVSAGGVSTQQEATRWVASLVTLPMLPPTHAERAAGQAADNDDLNDPEDDSYLGVTAGGVADFVRMARRSSRMACNHTDSERGTACDNKPAQPMWLVPAAM